MDSFHKPLIVLFCCWHMAAIGVYSYASGLEKSTMHWLHDRVIDLRLADESARGYEPYTWLNTKLKPYFRAYILSTSQWQRWNLFSPDPLRRVSTYVFEVQREGSWQPFYEISADSTTWWRKAYWLKTLRRLEEDRYEPIRERLVKQLCQQRGIPKGKAVRMRRRYYVIPKHAELTSPRWWWEFEPEWQENTQVHTLCTNQKA